MIRTVRVPDRGSPGAIDVHMRAEGQVRYTLVIFPAVLEERNLKTKHRDRPGLPHGDLIQGLVMGLTSLFTEVGQRSSSTGLDSVSLRLKRRWTPMGRR